MEEKGLMRRRLALAILSAFCIILLSCPAFLNPDRVVSFIPVEDISNVPTDARVGVPLALSARVTPANATNQTIIWMLKTSEEDDEDEEDEKPKNIINGNQLMTADEGIVIVTAVIPRGGPSKSDFTKDFIIFAGYGFVQVEEIVNVPAEVFLDVPLDLDAYAKVMPEIATDQIINWSVYTGPATITGSILTAEEAGEIIIHADINHGLDWGEKFLQTFEIMAIQPVKDISGIPEFMLMTNAPFDLKTVKIEPPDATRREIIWEVTEGPAVINENQ